MLEPKDIMGGAVQLLAVGFTKTLLENFSSGTNSYKTVSSLFTIHGINEKTGALVCSLHSDKDGVSFINKDLFPVDVLAHIVAITLGGIIEEAHVSGTPTLNS